MDVDDYISMEDAAQLSGYTRRMITNLCVAGKLPGARKMGNQWIVPRQALLEYRPDPPGPKPGSKRKKKEDPLEAELREAIAQAKARKERGSREG